MATFANGQGVNGLLGAFVDDLLGTGECKFNSALNKISSRFESKPRVHDDIYLASVHIKRSDNGTNTVDQAAHIENLEKLSKNPTLINFDQNDTLEHGSHKHDQKYRLQQIFFRK